MPDHWKVLLLFDPKKHRCGLFDKNSRRLREMLQLCELICCRIGDACLQLEEGDGTATIAGNFPNPGELQNRAECLVSTPRRQPAYLPRHDAAHF